MKYLKLYEHFRLITEAAYKDVEVKLSKKKRGFSEPEARSFDIILTNPTVVKNLQEHKMGKPGSMQSFFYKGPGGERYTKYEWDAETTAWDVWQQMNYIVLTPKNQIHWLHGKQMGGEKHDPNPKDGYEGSTGEKLPKLDIKGYDVYRALLDDPKVGYIISERDSSKEIKDKVYRWLFDVPDYIWIKSGDPKKLEANPLDYDMVVVMNPKYCDSKEVEKKFREIKTGDPETQPNLEATFSYSVNFPK